MVRLSFKCKYNEYGYAVKHIPWENGVIDKHTHGESF